MNLKEVFGSRLKELRKSKKYTQETLAEMIDLSPRQLIRIENGENFPTSDTIEKISAALNIKLECLFDFGCNKDIPLKTGKYTKPTIKITKTGNNVSIKALNHSTDLNGFEQNQCNPNDYETKLLDFCKKQNKQLTAEIFEDKKHLAIKTFNPQGQIELVLSSEDLTKNSLYNDILKKLNNLSSDTNRLVYVKLAIDSLEDKHALEQMKSIIQGFELFLK